MTIAMYAIQAITWSHEGFAEKLKMPDSKTPYQLLGSYQELMS